MNHVVMSTTVHSTATKHAESINFGILVFTLNFLDLEFKQHSAKSVDLEQIASHAFLLANILLRGLAFVLGWS